MTQPRKDRLARGNSRPSLIVSLLALIAVAFGFGLARHQRSPPQGPSRYAPRPVGTLTFTKEIAPIIYQHCASCHRPGQSAPFNLLSYTDVKKRAGQIV